MELRRELERRLRETAAPELDLAVDIEVVSEPAIRVILTGGKAWFAAGEESRLAARARAECPRPEGGASFIFESAETAATILYGDGDFVTAFMDAFMAGKVRSDGYLPFTFTLLGLFRPGWPMQTPD